MSEELRNLNNYCEDGLLDPLFDAFMAIPVDSKNGNRLMKTDIEELGDKYVLNVDMPGIKKENIKVSSKNGYVNISYKQEEVKEENDKKHFVRKERYFGQANRGFYLGEIDSEHINASLNDGVLTISVPKLLKKDDSYNVVIK
jgi:HSP20 family protein